ncbi:MAG: pyrimidine 5'-nucleotidase [Sphingorhabdus sp.]
MLAAPIISSLAHIQIWIFDLDLTLYTPEHNIMEQVRERIGQYVQRHFNVEAEAAHRIRHDYWRKYGTTLGGLMAEHGVDPHGYLDFVHDVDMARLHPCDRLRAGIGALPGRKLIFTNADAPYAERVLAARGLDGLFEGMFDIHCMGHRPKPEPNSYDRFCAAFDFNPQTALFVEDSAHNLEPAKAMGMTTVWVNHAAGQETDGECPSYVDYEINDVADWLHAIREREAV